MDMLRYLTDQVNLEILSSTFFYFIMQLKENLKL